MSDTRNSIPVKETFHGYIESTRDSLLLFEACKRGLLPRIKRRLQDRERYLIRSGSIFCFDENESGIKRWTDGLVWSPSRILGNFLIYRELDDKKLTRNHTYTVTNTNSGIIRGLCSTSKSNSGYIGAPDLLKNQREKTLVGSLKNVSNFKRNGLIKKSMSLIVDGVQQHIVSYYSKEDVMINKLKTPSSIIELSLLEVSPGLRLRQNFRNSSIDGSSDDRNKRRYTNDTELTQPQRIDSIASPSPHSSESSQTSDSNPSVFTSQSPVTSLYTSVTHVTNNIYPTTTDTVPSDLNHHVNQKDTYTAVQTESNTSFSFQQNNTDLTTSLLKEPQEAASQILDTSFTDRTRTNNITLDKSLNNNSKATSYHTNETPMNTTTAVTESIFNSNGGYYAQQTYHDDFFQGQNPHQHLFSSSSFHAVNHAAIAHRNEIATNSFMIDINLLLGTGWNDFELQM